MVLPDIGDPTLNPFSQVHEVLGMDGINITSSVHFSPFLIMLGVTILLLVGFMSQVGTTLALGFSGLILMAVNSKITTN